MMNKWKFILVILFGVICLSSCKSEEEKYYEQLINQEFVVKFVNWDGSLLYQTTVKYGEDAVYNGATPTKPSTSTEVFEFLYFFNTDNITKDTVCSAQFKSSPNYNSDEYTNISAKYEKCSNGYKIVQVYGSFTLNNDGDLNTEKRHLVFPTYYKGEPVVAIGDYALFKDMDYLKKFKTVQLPKYLEEIGEWAFAGMTYLKEITFPSTLKKIGDYAFNGCGYITKITLNEGLKSIGKSAFVYMGCYNTSILSIYISSSVEYIGASAFESRGNHIMRCAATSKPSGWDKNWNKRYNEENIRVEIFYQTYWGVNR